MNVAILIPNFICIRDISPDCNILSGPILFSGKGNSKGWFENLPIDRNPDYMVYMDDFNRASTAQVSPLNAVNLPCGVSNKRNYIQVEIPLVRLPKTS